MTRPILKLIGKWGLGHEDSYSPIALAKMLKRTGFRKIVYGIIPTGLLFGMFALYLPYGEQIFKAVSKLSYFIEERQPILGFWSYSIGYK